MLTWHVDSGLGADVALMMPVAAQATQRHRDHAWMRLAEVCAGGSGYAASTWLLACLGTCGGAVVPLLEKREKHG